jgi:hypothetical protein
LVVPRNDLVEGIAFRTLDFLRGDNRTTTTLVYYFLLEDVPFGETFFVARLSSRVVVRVVPFRAFDHRNGSIFLTPCIFDIFMHLFWSLDVIGIYIVLFYLFYEKKTDDGCGWENVFFL